MELQKYEPIVKSVASKYLNSTLKNHSVLDFEDVTQELWIHLYKVLPSFTELPQNEIFKLVKTCLDNKAKDIYNFYARRVNCSDYSSDDECMVADGYLDQFDIYKLKEFRRIIFGWADSMDEQTSLFVRELFEPSEETLDTWFVMKAKSPNRPKSCGEGIRPFVLRKILGISQHKTYRILDNLADVLRKYEYIN